MTDYISTSAATTIHMRDAEPLLRHPRIPPRQDLGGDVGETLDKTPNIEAGIPLNLFATLAHHPRLLRRFNALGGLFLVHGELPGRERELVVLRTAWRTGSEYEWGQHVLIARKEGLSEEEIFRVARLAVDKVWPDDDRTLLLFTDELLDRADVGDERWLAASMQWTDVQLIEIVLLAGFYRMVAGFLNAVQVEREPQIPGWPPALATDGFGTAI